MADISIKKEHGLSLEEAQGKIDKVVTDIKAEFSSLIKSIDWDKSKTNAKVKGKGFSGNFSVDETNIGIDVDLSFFAKPFKEKVETKIHERLTTYFSAEAE